MSDDHSMSTDLARDGQREAILALSVLLNDVVGDAPNISRILLRRFGSLGATLAATTPQLMSVTNMTLAVATRLRALNTVHLYALQEELHNRHVIGSWPALERYVLAMLRCNPIEQARGLFLDRKNGLISDELLGQGTVDHTPLYPREVARKALELHASALILVHNHPSGDPTPSKADIQMTRRIEAALATIEVVLHDHAIVGRNRVLSMRATGHI